MSSWHSRRIMPGGGGSALQVERQGGAGCDNQVGLEVFMSSNCRGDGSRPVQPSPAQRGTVQAARSISPRSAPHNSGAVPSPPTHPPEPSAAAELHKVLAVTQHLQAGRRAGRASRHSIRQHQAGGFKEAGRQAGRQAGGSAHLDHPTKHPSSYPAPNTRFTPAPTCTSLPNRSS
jgi:hypothetical protein